MVTNNTFDWTIENNKAFKDKLDFLGTAVTDFRIPFRLISSDFYRSQKKLFTLQGAGLYNPLGGFNYNDIEANGRTKRRNAEDRKERFTKHPWAPILYGKTGDLRDSTLSNSHKYSLFYLNKQELQIGSSVPYGPFHQSDKARKKLPQRKFIFIDGGPADKSKDSSIAGRRERWFSIIDTHVKQVLTGSI